MSENILDGAILQRDKESYAIVPRTPVGLISPEVLDALNTVVKKYGIPIVKITSGQRIALVGMKKEQLPTSGRTWARTSAGPRACACIMWRPVRAPRSVSSAS